MPHNFLDFLLVTLAGALAFAILSGIGYLVYYFMTLPMRRAERARFFVDLIESTLRDGQPLEETIVAISQSHERAVGLRFHIVAAWIESGLSLGEALVRTPRFLPPQVAAMLRAGQQMGDLRKVLPACRQMLKDASFEARGSISYVLIVTFFTTALGWIIFTMVIPRLREIGYSFQIEAQSNAALFIFSCGRTWIIPQVVMLLVLMSAAGLYAGGPRLAAWLPFLDRLNYRLPWRRTRMQRDFSTMLGILLDSGVPEAEAVRLAAGSAANHVFRRRAEGVVARLFAGAPLPEAVQALDDSGEFGWRLRNAFHAHTKFFRALQGWIEALDAKAFQQQHTVEQSVTSALVLWNGLFVGSIMVSVFLFLISILNEGSLW
ncbi:MAG TPA: type II secretion system F family protein [Verrucomicrobiae bacterium]|jgi:type II secretory pathway component PulF|nr:type II secretion system F family protein [Verrucomicrobiae bacterium]